MPHHAALFEPLTFAHGRPMRNRMMLAPLTNSQSHPDGRLSDAERDWLLMRASGGFGLTMTAASHVQPSGQGFAGQLAIHSDAFLEGLAALAREIQATGSLAAVQLHHAGVRAFGEVVPELVGPSDDPETGARGLSEREVVQLGEDFVAAAVRAQTAGFDGVEIHGAHGYVLTQFLSAETNHREDAYGGSVENRSRLLLDVLAGVRERCGPDFQLGLRLSAERYGIRLTEAVDLVQELFVRGEIDYLDLSLWNARKRPVEEQHQDRTLLEHFTDLDRGQVRLGVAGKIMTAADASDVLAAGADFVLIGRAAILHHDFPELCRVDPGFAAVPTPVTSDYLVAQGLSAPFVDYMRSFPGFVAAV
jgi:2,4-dienoyl-CoA reductase-like NADH-dependent reductase (Old Yellow Enzyme family)